MSERADAVVIGAGLGGLAAAAVLAGEGAGVTLLEAESSPGGYASAFQEGAYRFDTALHALQGLAPGGGYDEMYRTLGILDRLRLHRLDPLYRLQLPDRVIDAHADPFRYERELVEQFPEQRDGIRAYFDEVAAVYRDGRRLRVDRAAGESPTLAEVVARYPAYARISGQTWEQMLARYVTDARVRAVLAGLWSYLVLPPSRLDAAVGAWGRSSYHEYGAWYPEGGSQAISDALAAVIRERGGELHYGRRVVGIELADERATAVVTADGQRHRADLVISDASAPTTVLEWIGAGRLPADYVRRVQTPRPGCTTFAVYLGLDRDVFAEHGLPHELILAPSYDIDAMFGAAERGDWEQAELLVTDYTRVDPGCAPPGHGTVVVTTLADWEYEDTWGTGGHLTDYGSGPRYRQLKERVADALVARADRAVPGLAAAVRVRKASTPLTNFRWTANPRGAIEGYENTPENSGAGWLGARTPIRNLFLAGAWTTAGGMNTCMQSGEHAARLALRHALPAAAGV